MKFRPLVFAMVVMLGSLFLTVHPSVSKEIGVVVEYAYDLEDPALIQEYQFFVELTDGNKTLVAVVPVGAANGADEAFEVTNANIPIGKTFNYFLAAVHKDGEVVMSPAFAFKATGKVVIKKISR